MCRGSILVNMTIENVEIELKNSVMVLHSTEKYQRDSVNKIRHTNVNKLLRQQTITLVHEDKSVWKRSKNTSEA